MRGEGKKEQCLIHMNKPDWRKSRNTQETNFYLKLYSKQPSLGGNSFWIKSRAGLATYSPLVKSGSLPVIVRLLDNHFYSFNI